MERAEGGDAGAQDVHRVRGGGELLKDEADGLGKVAERDEARAVAGEFGGGGEAFVDEEVGDLFVAGVLGEIGDVVAAVVEVVAGLADGADRGVACDDAGEGDGFFRGASGGGGSGIGAHGWEGVNHRDTEKDTWAEVRLGVSVSLWFSYFL